MRIETHVRVEAPPRTAFEFFAWLDHLRLVSPSRRREWCPSPGSRIAEGVSHEVCLEQGRHRVRLRFTTEVLRPAETIVDVFSTWPLEGARRTLRFVPDEDEKDRPPGTLIIEEDEWRPPFFVRPLIDKRFEQQRELFEEKLEKAARIISQAYATFGSEAFAEGVLEPAASLGLDELAGRRAGRPGA